MFPKIIIGLVTFIIAVLAIVVENKKEGKITKWGWFVFVLLTVLAGFTIYSDVSEELSESEEREQRHILESKAATKREREYKEYIEYLSTLKDKSEKTLIKFDSSASVQNLLLQKSQEINSELGKSKDLQSKIRQLSQMSLEETRKALYPFSDSIYAYTNFSIKNDGLQEQFRKEKATNKEFSISKDCKFDTIEHKITGKILSDILKLIQLATLKISFVKDERIIQFSSYDMSDYKNYQHLDLCKENIDFYITDVDIVFALRFKLKLLSSFYFPSVLDLQNSLAIIDVGTMPAAQNLHEFDRSRIMDTITTLKEVTIVFDEKKSLYSYPMKVSRSGVDTFYIENFKIKTSLKR